MRFRTVVMCSFQRSLRISPWIFVSFSLRIRELTKKDATKEQDEHNNQYHQQYVINKFSMCFTEKEMKLHLSVVYKFLDFPPRLTSMHLLCVSPILRSFWKRRGFSAWYDQGDMTPLPSICLLQMLCKTCFHIPLGLSNVYISAIGAGNFVHPSRCQKDFKLVGCSCCWKWLPNHVSPVFVSMKGKLPSVPKLLSVWAVYSAPVWWPLDFEASSWCTEELLYPSYWK